MKDNLKECVHTQLHEADQHKIEMKVKKPHPIVNKLQHAVRHNRLWRVRKFLDKKREIKKQGVDYEE